MLWVFVVPVLIINHTKILFYLHYEWELFQEGAKSKVDDPNYIVGHLDGSLNIRNYIRLTVGWNFDINVRLVCLLIG